MKCMKCGRDVDGDKVFCMDCQVDMEKYPVKPGATVLLPKREEAPVPRKSHFRPVLTPDEQIRKLRNRVHRLTIALAVALLLLGGLSFFLARHLQSHQQLRPGQNYSAVTADSNNGD